MTEGTTEYRMGNIPIERTRAAWSRAAEFPPNKEDVYPEHAQAQEFDLHRGKRVLEYGCGGGADAMSYLRRQCEVTYVDVVPDNVVAASARIKAAGLHQKAHWIKLDESDRIPIPSGLFDVANADGVIHHIAKPIPVLQEIRRLLKPGGLFYCMLYTEILYARHVDTVARLVSEKGLSNEEAFCWCTDGPGTPHAVYYTEETGTRLLESAGFKVERAFVYQSDEFRTFRARAT